MNAPFVPEQEITQNSSRLGPIQGQRKANRDGLVFIKVILMLFLLLLLSSTFVVVNAGQRGVLLKFGRVQPQILDEGLHFIIPIVHTVETLSVRVQNQEISAEASSKDLQDVFTDVALNWHILPEEANLAFQQIGDMQAMITRIINPAVEEVLKAVMAQYTAEELITRRGSVKSEVDDALKSRLQTYHVAVDDISLVHVHFSQRFSEAVEAKQIAEQEAKRAEFLTLKAQREAEARINQAKGEAEAQRLVQSTLTSDLLYKQTIERWNGNLPLITDRDKTTALFDLSQFANPNLAPNSALRAK